MSAVISIKQHDTKITFTDDPTIDGVTIDYTDFAGSTVSFVMKGVADDRSQVAIKQAAAIVNNSSKARFTYDPISGDVAKSGKFKQEWEVIYASGKIATFPNDGYNTVNILPDLG
jgi:catabolite regulation protein CreA